MLAARGLSLGILCAAALVTLPAAAQDLAVAGTSFGGDTWVARDAPIQLTLSRGVDPSEGRLAVFVGTLDVSHLVRVDGAKLVYDPGTVPLESGPQEVSVYLVTPDEQWIEIDRRPIQVLTRAGFQEADVDPRLDVAFEAQVTERHSDDFGNVDRHKYLKGTGAGGWTSRHLGYGMELDTNANIVGSTWQTEALRFAELDTAAPRIDLADYLIQLRRGDASFRAGHYTYGTHRHLLNAVTTRGVGVGYQVHPRVDISGSSMSSTRVVGWNNIVGIENSENVINSGTLGIDILQNEFGNARFEGTWMSGSLLSQSNFNVGEITDAEKSWGYGLRLFGDLFWGRVRSDVSWARSRFDNPADPFLNLGPLAFDTDTVWESARYGELAVDLLQNRHLFGERYATFTVFASHERIDPLYKSLGAFTNADTQTNQYGFLADIGGIFVQVQKTFIEDNLDDIEDILKTRTRDTLITAQIPLPFLVGSYAEPMVWLPTLSVTWNRIHQFGANKPDPLTSGFAPNAIPDQVDVLWDASATWTFERVSFTYRYSRSAQDNRQQGRERDDFQQDTHDVSLSVQPVDTLFLNLGASRTRQWDRGLDLRRRTLSTSGSFDWQFLPGWTLSGLAFRTRETDSEGAVRVVSTSLDAQLAYQFTIPTWGRHEIPARVFTRWSRQSSRFTDDVFDIRTRTRNWIWLVGGSFSIF